MGGQGIRTAEAHAFRIWRARAGWGSTPDDETWAAIFTVAKRAEGWLHAYEERGGEELAWDEAVVAEPDVQAVAVAPI